MTYPTLLRQPRGFTLVELLVSTAVITLLLLILVQMTGQTAATWRYTTGKAEQFREARSAFETMTRRISQATLNTYLDYTYGTGNKVTGYERQSELRFASGPMQVAQAGTKQLDHQSTIPRPTHGIFFQAPFGYVSAVPGNDGTAVEGLETLLNTWGYYLEVADDKDLRPAFITEAIAPPKVRSRLIEMMQPATSMMIYRFTSGTPTSNATTVKGYNQFDWIHAGLKQSTTGTPETTPISHVLATNIIALGILPKLSESDAEESSIPPDQRDTLLAPKYYYHSAEVGPAASTSVPAKLRGLVNTKHQLPPLIQVTMVAVDETTYSRLGVESVSEDPLLVRENDFLVDPAKYSEDLLYSARNGAGAESLEKRMIDKRLNYRIFTTNIYLRGAKWSKEQLN
jgi:uncharacterized protein (TIGR02599 family)